MKINGMRRAIVLAHAFNLLVALYFIIISIVSLVKLRWYHQLTITIRVRHFVTSATSYFAFLILIFAAIILVIIFVINAVNFSTKVYVSANQDAIELQRSNSPVEPISSAAIENYSSKQVSNDRLSPDSGAIRQLQQQHQQHSTRPLVIKDSTTASSSLSNQTVCCSILLHLLTSVSLIIILIVWLLNTGELVRDSVSTQLDAAFSKYQFANRSNHFSIAIDGMQDINNCCGSFDYTDFPHHQRMTGLSSGHYPGSCCGKNIFGVNARVICTPEEIVRAKQTTGCVTVLSNYYDLISLLVVPVALISLFVNITMIAMITMTKSNYNSLDDQRQSDHLFGRSAIRRPNSRSEQNTSCKLELRSGD